MQLHVFSDASERAFAAAIYSRVNDSLGNISVNLLSSKTRVAPVKTVSLPRLEVCGAQLASKLCGSLLTILRPLDIEVTSYTWTDSTIVLQWLAQLPRTWSTFIANRVSSIQQILPRSHWRYVSSKDNPADLASRGCNVKQLIKTDLWWKGPQWLEGSPEAWPQAPPSVSIVSEDTLERRPTAQIFLKNEQEQSSTPAVGNFQNTNIEKVSEDFIDISKYSSFDKLVRITSYVINFVSRLLRRNNDNALHPKNQRLA